MREVEFKYAVHPSFHLQDIEGRAGVETILALAPLDLTSTYYDTRDLRLARSGITLRFRTGEAKPIWTLKLPSHGSDAAVRDELNFEGSPDEIPSDAADLAVGQTRDERLERVARLVTRREGWKLLGDDGEELAVVHQDDVAVMEHGQVLTRFKEIELESLGVDLKRLRSLGVVLSDLGAVPAESLPKAVRALGPRATAPPDLPAPPELDPKSPAREAIQSMIVRGVQRVISNHAAARSGSEEGVHQMRVGTRRLRSDLRTFGALLDETWASSVIPNLKWLADSLGKARDVDVLIARLERDAGDLRGDLAPLFEELEGRRTLHRSDLYETLRSDRYRLLLETLVRAGQNPPVAPEASLPCEEVLVAPVVATWKKLRETVRGGGKEPDASTLHKIRIRAKRARYAAEAIGPALGPESTKAATFSKRAANLQDVLGEHQDAVVAQEKLRVIATRHRSDAGFVMMVGRLLERECVAAERARKRWRPAWRELKRNKNTSWLKT